MTVRPTALILGITGSYGLCMAESLARAGYRLKALVRDRERAKERVSALEVALYEGDIMDRARVLAAARECAVIVHGVNPTYDRWEPFVVNAARVVGEVAATVGATVLFPGNVYAYASDIGIAESACPDPPTDKGRIRLEAERALVDATARGARLIVLRGGDFFGRATESSWMTEMLKRVPKGGPLIWPGPAELRHQWAYLPDFAAAHVALLHRSEIPAAAFFHFGGHVFTGDELLAVVRELIGDPDRRARRLPWALIGLGGWFSPLLRALYRMRYLWSEELTLDGTRLTHTLGAQQSLQTPLRDAIAVHLRELADTVSAPVVPVAT